MKGNIDIIPAQSIAGIRIGDNIMDLYEALEKDYQVSYGDGYIKLDNGLLIVFYDDNDLIYSIMCHVPFEGCYQNKLWAGMTVQDVLNNSKYQLASLGRVEVDGIAGIGLPLPEGFDDFERLTDWLSRDFVFQYLAVY